MIGILTLGSLTHAETIGFFGLAAAKNQEKARELFSPMLSDGLEEVQFGDDRAAVMSKRNEAKTKKRTIPNAIISEEVPAEEWGKKPLHFYSIRYGYDEGTGAGGRGLDSIRLDGVCDDTTRRFEACKSLISASFLAFGTPSQVISVDSYGGDKVAALFLYWDGAKCPVWMRISHSVSPDRVNLFLVAELPRKDTKPAPRPEGMVTELPSATKFKELYAAWINVAD